VQAFLSPLRRSSCPRSGGPRLLEVGGLLSSQRSHSRTSAVGKRSDHVRSKPTALGQLGVRRQPRKGVSIVTAGWDHLTHRLQARLPSPGAVAAALAVAQVAVSLVTIAAARVGRTSIIVVATGCLALGAAIVAVLDSPTWTAVPPRPGGYEARDESDP
jgi:hypothetical protein